MALYEVTPGLAKIIVKYTLLSGIAFGTGYCKGYLHGREDVNKKITGALERLIDIEENKNYIGKNHQGGD